MSELLARAKTKPGWKPGSNGRVALLDRYPRHETVALARAYFAREITATDIARACGFTVQYVGAFLLGVLNRELEGGALQLDWLDTEETYDPRSRG